MNKRLFNRLPGHSLPRPVPSTHPPIHPAVHQPVTTHSHTGKFGFELSENVVVVGQIGGENATDEFRAKSGYCRTAMRVRG